MAVASSESISGVEMMAANQLLFTIREYDLTLIGGWLSFMETEILRLGLYRKNLRIVLFTERGLEQEDFTSFLEPRFIPPLGDFPERDEYHRRAGAGELLIISSAPPANAGITKSEAVYRNQLACVLADVTFIPSGSKGTKTYSLASWLVAKNIPVFTADHESNADLQTLGIPCLTRRTVKHYLENLGCRKAEKGAAKIMPLESLEKAAVEKVPIKSQSELDL